MIFIGYSLFESHTISLNSVQCILFFNFSLEARLKCVCLSSKNTEIIFKWFYGLLHWIYIQKPLVHGSYQECLWEICLNSKIIIRSLLKRITISCLVLLINICSIQIITLKKYKISKWNTRSLPILEAHSNTSTVFFASQRNGGARMVALSSKLGENK